MRRVRPPESKREGTAAAASTDASRRRAVPSDRPSTPPSPVEPWFVRPQTFFGLPAHPVTGPVPAVDVLLTGVPYDGGALERTGARFAPRAVREASLRLGGYSEALGIHVWDEITSADGGDVAAVDDSAHALDRIAERAEAAARSGVVGGFVGGDQTVTLGVLRGIHRAKLKSVAMLHIDASTDTLGKAGAREVHHKSVLRIAREEGLVRADSVLQVGVRGPYSSDREIGNAIGAGFEIVKADDVKWDLHAAVSQIRRVVRQGSLYVSVDVSVLDPAYAPGALGTRPGGLSTWELQQVLRALVGAQIVGFDVVEIAPQSDPSGITALAGASVVHELLAVIADTHRSAGPAPSTTGRRRGRRVSP
ncbi:MAG TPA: arginase family protein [Polyangiaceae bacterium]|nr:arginase family protein [Polyangiaceae bacterium]